MLTLATIAGLAGAPAEDRCDAAPRRAQPFAPVTADSGVLFRGSLSSDGRTLYYFKKVTPNQEDYRIFVTRLENGRWTSPEKLLIGGDYSELYPTLSADGRRMVFSSYRPVPGDTSSHPNAHLWLVDRKGAGWSEPRLMAESSRLGHYHSGPRIQPNGDVRFRRTAPDWRSDTSFVVSPSGSGYGPARVDPELERWRGGLRSDLQISGAQWGPDRRFVLLEASPRSALTGRAGSPDIWAAVRRGSTWSEPAPLGAGVNTGVTENFAFISPDGCSLIFTRGFSGFYQVSIAAALAERGAAPEPWAAGLGSATTVPLEGFYRGAFVRGGSVQVVDAELVRVRDTLRIAMTSPDRLAPFPLSRVMRSGSSVSFLSPYGPITARFDSVYGDMIGQGTRDSVATTLHLKRAPSPARPAIERRDVTFASSGVTLAGTVIKPVGIPIVAGIVYIAGRGCVTRAGGLRLLENLAPHGIAGIAVDKRGMGQSTGNCPFATIGQFSDDAAAALESLRQVLGPGPIPVGFLGVSAGGWVAVHAAGRATRPIDFLITNVGPATSVKQQQLDNATSIARRLGLTPEQTARAQRYVELMFAPEVTERRYDEMKATVEWAKGVGFADEFFEASDIPTSIGGLDSLWVRLNDYDPAPDLARLQIPILAFFGGADEVVPPVENVRALRRIASEARNERVRIVVVPGGDHGLFQAEGSQPGDGGSAHWRFGRLSPLYLEGIVAFLNRR